ncbi:hypothetical protein J4410_07600 [Candidatus Woesearchaeota archaeon]|nr:hypothetical protein [Candidatus Woesearchaeota archaeon]
MKKEMETEIEGIKERNKRVEVDKAWETSYTRRLIIGIMTYLIAVWFMYSLNLGHPWLQALIPTGGYFLSTLSLGVIKKYWIKKLYKK